MTLRSFLNCSCLFQASHHVDTGRLIFFLGVFPGLNWHRSSPGAFLTAQFYLDPSEIFGIDIWKKSSILCGKVAILLFTPFYEKDVIYDHFQHWFLGDLSADFSLSSKLTTKAYPFLPIPSSVFRPEPFSQLQVSSLSLGSFVMDHYIWKSGERNQHNLPCWGRGRDVLLPMLCLTTVVSTTICRKPGGSIEQEVCAALSSTRTSAPRFVLLS